MHSERAVRSAQLTRLINGIPLRTSEPEEIPCLIWSSENLFLAPGLLPSGDPVPTRTCQRSEVLNSDPVGFGGSHAAIGDHSQPGGAVGAFEAVPQENHKAGGKSMTAQQSRSLAVGKTTAPCENRAKAQRATAWREHEELSHPQAQPEGADSQALAHQFVAIGQRSEHDQSKEQDNQKPLKEEESCCKSEGSQPLLAFEFWHFRDWRGQLGAA